MGDVIEPVQATRADIERREGYALWGRRAMICLLTAVVVVALFNVFGQRAGTTTVRSAAADLSVHAPSRVRAGLLYQVKIVVSAHQRLPDATLVMGAGFIDGMTQNTNEPSASSETSGPGGSLLLSLGTLQPGDTNVRYFDYQVNPTSVSGRQQTLVLQSAGVPVVTLHRSVTVFP